MVHLHHSSNSNGGDTSEDEHHHHHVSIASLRSKFENLSHSGQVDSGSPRPATAKLPVPRANAAVVTDATASPVPPQGSTPTVVPPSPLSAKTTEVSSSSASQPMPKSTPIPIMPIATSSSPQRDSFISPSQTTVSGSHLVAHGNALSPMLSRSPVSAPLSRLASNNNNTPLGSATESYPPPTDKLSASPDNDVEDTPLSVQALRQRFGQAAPPNPSLSAAARRPDVQSSFPATTSEASTSRPRPPSPPPVASKPQISKPLPAPKPVVGSLPLKPSPSTITSKPPPPKPPVSRSHTPVVPDPSGQLAPTSATSSRASSPSTNRLMHPPPPAPRSQLTPSPTPSRSSSPAHRPAPPHPRLPSPSPLAASPAPTSTTESRTTSSPIPPSSVKPPLPVRKATILSSSVSDSNPSVMSAQENLPPPVPLTRPTLVASAPPTASAAALASATLAVPPPLPQTRRPSLVGASAPVDIASSVPPPLPRTARPTADSGAQGIALVPPPLPLANKRPSAPESVPLAPASVPRLPARRPTLVDAVPLSAPPLPANKPLAPTIGTESSTLSLPDSSTSRPRAQSLTAIRPRVPVRAATLPVHPDGFVPPPPPLRSAVVASAPAPSTLARNTIAAAPGASLARSPSTAVTLYGNGSTAKRTGTPVRNNSGGGDSDEDEEYGGSQQTTSTAQRLLDEHPDTTHANRRPPEFSPHVKVSATQHITSFAVYGRYACVAHHTVKVYDTQLGGEQPILVFDPREAALETRTKEPRVTAMCFRPSGLPEQAGRYLWCGNKDGHLWELDIRTGEVTNMKTFSHAGHITHIMPCGLAMVSLDDVGKLQVWEDTESHGNFKLTRTLRISEKITFARIIKSDLWTATAPAVRSATTTAGVRGPTVRVYSICAPGSIPAPLVALTTEWTGAATSATIMPLEPDKVYMGHEGGFVSVWRTEGNVLECLHVFKVSSTDILALEGVGERLWAANRRGQIHVWDLNEMPWLTTNRWTTHDEHPINALVVDPASIGETGRFMLWSCSRESLQAWDGLLAVDWIDKRMVERQPEYSAFRDVRVLVCSWNIDSSRPSDLTGSPENTSFLDQVLHSVESPDIIVFGFQEVVPLTDKKLTAKTLLFGHKGKDGGGATNDRVSERYRAWADKLQYAVRLAMPTDTPYAKVHSEQLVGLFSCMFVKQTEREALRDVNITTVKRGIGGIYGNKGAIVARLVMDDTSMCFINVHLAAGQSHRAARTADLAAIMEDKTSFPAADRLPYVNGGNGTEIFDHEMVVLNGDLNYRIDQRRELVISSIKSGEFDFLLEHDQLHKEMRGNHAFRLRSFAEAPIHFAPTYKYDPGTNNYDSSDKRRIPAWCDRVLFMQNPRIAPLSYRRYEITCSDHKPVSAGLGMTIKRVDPVRMRTVQREVVAEWHKREAELLVKIAEAYTSLY